MSYPLCEVRKLDGAGTLPLKLRPLALRFDVVSARGSLNGRVHLARGVLVLLVLVVLIDIVISPRGALLIPTRRVVAWHFFLLAGGGALGLRGRV